MSEANVTFKSGLGGSRGVLGLGWLFTRRQAWKYAFELGLRTRDRARRELADRCRALALEYEKQGAKEYARACRKCADVVERETDQEKRNRQHAV